MSPYGPTINPSHVSLTRVRDRDNILFLVCCQYVVEAKCLENLITKMYSKKEIVQALRQIGFYISLALLIDIPLTPMPRYCQKIHKIITELFLHDIDVHIGVILTFDSYNEYSPFLRFPRGFAVSQFQ